TLRVFPVQLQAAVPDAERGRGQGEAAGPAHDLQALAVLVGHELGHVQVGDLGRDLDGVLRGVEAADGADAAAAVDTRRPERFLADAVGGHHAQPGDDDSAHGHSSPEARKLSVNPRTVLALGGPPPWRYRLRWRFSYFILVWRPERNQFGVNSPKVKKCPRAGHFAEFSEYAGCSCSAGRVRGSWSP